MCLHCVYRPRRLLYSSWGWVVRTVRNQLVTQCKQPLKFASYWYHLVALLGFLPVGVALVLLVLEHPVLMGLCFIISIPLHFQQFNLQTLASVPKYPVCWTVPTYAWFTWPVRNVHIPILTYWSIAVRRNESWRCCLWCSDVWQISLFIQMGIQLSRYQRCWFLSKNCMFDIILLQSTDKHVHKKALWQVWPI